MGSGVELLEDIKKQGSKNFITTLVEECNSEEELNDREVFWISKCDACNDPMFYNRAKGGNIVGLGDNFYRDLSKRMKGNTYGFKKGNIPWNKGKKHSPESILKMKKPHHVVTKGSKGLRWFNNGIINSYSEECPEGFVAGRLKLNIPKDFVHHSKGTKWYNNGLIEQQYKPGQEPDGFIPGRLKRK